MTPLSAFEIGEKLKTAIAASEDTPPEAALLVDLLAGMAFNLAHIARFARASGEPK